jgi:hypothetical protein
MRTDLVHRAWPAAALLLAAACSGGASSRPRPPSTTGGTTNPVCAAGTRRGPVQAPAFVRRLPVETGWFASPLVSDLGGGGKKVVAATYSVKVFDAQGTLLDSVPGNGKRVYAPHVVADLDGDGIVEVVFGQGSQVYAYGWVTGRLRLEPGWPVDTTVAGESPEVRGLAAADLDGDGRLEIVATTTQTQPAASGGAQVFVFSADGRLFQPAATPWPAWPRYNALTGPGGDADRNGAGHDGYGCYGLNVGIGNLDDDAAPEIVVTYDNHEIQVFKADGVAVDASPWFTNRESDWLGRRLTWGQFIRWADPKVEEDHDHLHTGAWPNPGAGQEWLQWTASPPSVVDLDGDGRAEVVGAPNVEKNEPYETQAFAVAVLDGAHGDGSRSAMRHAGWETLPRGERPIAVSGWYPPLGVPAIAAVNLQADARPELVVSLNDGFLYAFAPTGERLWRYDYTAGHAVAFASEPAVADLDGDGSPEVVFTTYGAPGDPGAGRLVVLAADGTPLHGVALPNPGSNGNGIGAPAAPTIADLDGDGQLEILVQTFDHGIDVFTVPGSGTACVPWTTARGGPLRTGAPSR